MNVIEYLCLLFIALMVSANFALWHHSYYAGMTIFGCMAFFHITLSK